MTIANMHPERWRLIDELFHPAIELPPNERGDFLEGACAGDVSLRAEIEKLIDGYDRAGSFIETPPALDGTTMVLPEPDAESSRGLRLGVYEVIREIGHGGMGTVYLAARADGEFRKRVAIKLVTAGFDHESIIQRFRNERQILAGLDHPNIARLLDGGTTESGAPYFVMEYIEGQTIRDYCDSHRLSTIARLKLFRTVCSAVHFAHQNLIVHRDIKPANILVTADGTAKLLDFGVAKLLSPITPTGEITETISRAMTPEYASPEQARGETITTASDVYSLGVLLYELLTGHRPYRVAGRSVIEIIDAICEQEPAKPSTAVGRTETSTGAGASTEVAITPEAVSKARDSEPHRLRRELQGDLDNIVLKAMRKEPQRRYASAGQFSEDINRHFEHLPVIAQQDTVSYRTSKFIARHKAGVAAATLLIIALLGGAVTTLWQAHVARQERDKAERRFNQVRQLANSVLFEYHDGIEKLPGSTPVREMLVRDALGYLDTLSQEAGDDPSLQRELAVAYRKVGDVQGGANYGNTGDTDGMLDSYRKALAIREAVASANPTNRDDRSALAGTYIDVGIALDRAGDPASKMIMSRKALAIYQELRAADRTGNSLRSDLAKAYWHVANASVTLGDLQSGIENYRSAGKIYEELSSAEPPNQLHRRNAALTDKYLATVLELSGDHLSAQELFRKAVARDQARVTGDPDNAGSKLDLAFSYRELGANLYNAGDLDGAGDNLQKALVLTLAVVEADPKNAFARAALAGVHQKIGETMSKQGNLVSALENHHRAMATYRALAAADPTNAEAKSYEAMSYSALGATYKILAASEKSPVRKQLEDWRAALLWFQRSSEIWAGLRKQGPLINAFAKEPEKVESEISVCEGTLVRLLGANSKK